MHMLARCETGLKKRRPHYPIIPSSGRSFKHLPSVEFEKEGETCNHFKVRTYVFPFTVPPLIAVRTFLLNASRLDRKSSAASLFKGSEAFGSKKRNWFEPTRQ